MYVISTTKKEAFCFFFFFFFCSASLKSKVCLTYSTSQCREATL